MIPWVDQILQTDNEVLESNLDNTTYHERDLEKSFGAGSFFIYHTFLT